MYRGSGGRRSSFALGVLGSGGGGGGGGCRGGGVGGGGGVGVRGGVVGGVRGLRALNWYAGFRTTFGLIESGSGSDSLSSDSSN